MGNSYCSRSIIHQGSCSHKHTYADSHYCVMCGVHTLCWASVHVLPLQAKPTQEGQWQRLWDGINVSVWVYWCKAKWNPQDTRHKGHKGPHKIQKCLTSIKGEGNEPCSRICFIELQKTCAYIYTKVCGHWYLKSFKEVVNVTIISS